MTVTSRPSRLALVLAALAALISGLAGAGTANASPDGYCAYSHPTKPSPVEEVVVCTP